VPSLGHVFSRGKCGKGGESKSQNVHQLNRLRCETGVVVMMVVAVVVAVVDNHHDLRLHHIRNCEAEDENQS
jgi:hypothetical protein